MADTILKRVLEKSIERELAEYDNAPEHKFSLKHRLAMKRIFIRYEKNSRKTIELSSATMPRYGLKQKVILALVIVILMTLLTGWFIPLRRFTEAQIDWLRSRYDFPNLMIRIPKQFTDLSTDPDYVLIGTWRTNDDYLDLLSDLEELGIYTAEEVEKIDSEYYIWLPKDTRPDSFKKETLIIEADIDYDNETPLSRAQYFVSIMEKRIEYYTERSKDKARAVDGDAEFAADIRDNYLTFYKNHLQLIEKLYADRHDDDSSEILNNVLFDLDKDDRKYLLEFNKIEKL